MRQLLSALAIRLVRVLLETPQRGDTRGELDAAVDAESDQSDVLPCSLENAGARVKRALSPVSAPAGETRWLQEFRRAPVASRQGADERAGP